MGDGEWLRRDALQILAQLPDDADHALAVLELAATFVMRLAACPNGPNGEKACAVDPAASPIIPLRFRRTASRD